MLLFEDLGTAKSNEELKQIQERYSTLDPAYVCQAVAESREADRQWMESLWAQYQPFADPNFIDEFRLHFTQRAWELYLGVTLISHGLKFGGKKAAGPDFCVLDEDSGNRVWVEAIAPEKGTGAGCVPEMKLDGTAMTVPEEEMLLRVASALHEKSKKHKTYIDKGIVMPSDPYVIAVNRSALEHVEPLGAGPLILKALFGIGPQVIRVPMGEGKAHSSETTFRRRKAIRKQSGSDVSMVFFEVAEHKHVSAVIYCEENVLNSPRAPSEMGENLVTAHNPNANNALRQCFFPFGSEYCVKGDEIVVTRKAIDWQKPQI